MRSIFAVILALLSLLFIPSCMGLMDIGMPEVTPIIHEYYTVGSVSTLSISRTDSRHPSPPGSYLIYGVQDLDWTDRYIVVKSDSYVLNPGVKPGGDPNALSWYIIDAANDHIYGPYQFGDYQEARTQLAIPDALEQLRPEEKEYAGYWRKHSTTR